MDPMNEELAQRNVIDRRIEHLQKSVTDLKNKTLPADELGQQRIRNLIFEINKLNRERNL